MNKLILITFFTFSISLLCITAEKNVICYYSSWAVYRPGNGKFEVEKIDPNLCTHIIYAFIGLKWDGTVRIMDTWNDVDLRAFQRFVDLTKQNTNLKALIAIGGWNEGSTVFSEVASKSNLRAVFVNDIYNFIKRYGFHGLDVDWEYPALRGGAPADKANFVTLLRDLKAKFQPEGLIVSIAVSAATSSVDISYDVPEISKYVDLINLMTYDFHGSWESQTGSNSPLYPSSRDGNMNVNADATVRYWLSKGAPASKLHLGAPLYGRTWTLQSTSSPGLGAFTTGPGAVGPYTQESGFMGYNEICEKFAAESWSINWAAQQKVPFAFRGNQWIGYDNVESVRIKAEYAKWKDLGGMLVWGIETDDYYNSCGQGKFALINTIKNTLNSAGVSADAYPPTQGPSGPSTVNWFASPTTTTLQPTTTTTRSATTTTTAPQPTTTTTRSATTTTTAPQPTTTTTRPATTTTKPTTTTTAKPSSAFSCVREGYARDPIDCAKFYYCQASGTGSYIKHVFTCPSNLYYSVERQVCDYRHLVTC